ncbi:MAG: DUF4143 domain-containing protein, partial [Pseudomonadota bacterium]
GQLFEQFVGLEIIRQGRFCEQRTRLYFWKDLNGPEVDWVISRKGNFIPIETKWHERPKVADARHLELFLDEYPNSQKGFVICRTPRPFTLTKRVTALPWQNIKELLENHL